MPSYTELDEFVPTSMTTTERDATWESPPNYLTIFNTTVGMYQVYGGQHWVSLSSYVTVGATAAPTVNDDADDGYNVGDRWIDTTNDEEYVCLDTTVGAAVWISTTYTDAEAIAAVEGEATLDLAGDVTIAAAKSLAVDTIAEKTGAAGVTVDGVVLKDGVVATGDVAFDDATSDPLVTGAAAADGTENSVARKDHVHPYSAAHGVTHNDVHGIAKHTEHANWKALYTDGSGDEQELALGAAGTVLAGQGAAAAPAFDAMSGDASIAAGGAVTVAATHSGSPHSNYIANALLTTRGDLVRRGAAAPERFAAVTAGAVVGGDGTDVVATVPKRTITLTAGGGRPTTTNGCAVAAKVEAGTNDVDYMVLDFDKDADEYAFWGPPATPDNWDGGTMTAVFYWTTASGGAAETVRWSIQLLALGNDDAIDSAWGAAVTVDDTWIADGDVHISAASGNITPGAPVSAAGGQLLFIRVMRDVSGDDLGGDARLMAVKLEYSVNAISD